MICIKSGVDVRELQPKIWTAVYVYESLLNKLKRKTWITSGTEGKHSPSSFHYIGLACDLRIKNIPKDKVQAVFNEFKALLGDIYDVVLHKTHIHVEYDPRRMLYKKHSNKN